jgi:hypothetical protein
VPGKMGCGFRSYGTGGWGGSAGTSCGTWNGDLTRERQVIDRLVVGLIFNGTLQLRLFSFSQSFYVRQISIFENFYTKYYV